MKTIAAMLLPVGVLSGTASTAFGLAEKAIDTGTNRAVHSEKSRNTQRPVRDIEGRLDEMKAQLKITSTQEAQWNGYADVLRRHAREMNERIQKRKVDGSNRSRTAIDRLEGRQQFLANASVRANDVLAAVKPLYESFNDEQKKVADQVLSRRGKHRKGSN